MAKIRFGVVGCGGMGSGHMRNMQSDDICELVAVCDIDEEAAQSRGEYFGVPWCNDYHELVDREDVDAVLVATPHYVHPQVTIYALEQGKPTVSEKPIAATVSAADAMVEAAKRTGTPFGVMYQSRTEAMWRAAHKIVAEGRLGEIYRTMMVYADWRSQAYYDSAGWRATWAGEGGGVLMNQAPHSIDRFTWLGGLPTKVKATTSIKNHVIEVEDVAAATLEYDNGAVGYIYCSTTELPLTEIMEFAGEKGKLQVVGQDIRFWEIPDGVKAFSDSTDQMWGRAEIIEVPVELTDCESGHIAILRNFARHLTEGEALIAPGIEGIKTVEMINAVILSGKTGEEVPVPVDRPRYDAFLQELIDGSTFKKRGGPDMRITDDVHH